MKQRVKEVQESDLRMDGALARNIQRVLAVTQADINTAAAAGKSWVVKPVIKVNDPIDNLRGGTQLVIKQNSITPGQNVMRVMYVAGPSVDVTVKGVAPLVLPDAVANSLSYVKAFGGTEQRNIPQPYTQVNYVTNTAQTAVDTGIMIDFAKNYEFEVECRATTGSWYILQSRASSSGNVTGIHGETSGSTIKLVVGNVTVCTSAITRTVGNKLYVKATLNNGTATLYVKDETANTEDTQTGSYGTSQPNPTAAVYLLGNAGGQYVGINSDIYMARIKENDTVVMDYVPCRQVATAGFYDKATGKFKTAETPANLSADGNTIPTPDAPMNIVCNNGALKARRHSGLPLDYQQIEWLKSTQMIELDKPTKDTYELQSSIYREDLTTQYIYQSDTTSSGTTNTTAYLSATVGNWRFDGQTKTVYVPELEQVITKQNKNGIWLNDTQIDTYTNVNSFTSTNNLRLFGTQSTPTMRLHWFKMLENETLVYDIIPVRKISTNELGVYDKVSGQFFTNSNSTLTAGNDISDPIEVYTDGTVETIKVCGKNLFDSSSDDNEWVKINGDIERPVTTKSNRISAHSGSVFTVSTSNAASSSNIILVTFWGEGGEMLLRQAYTSGTTHTVTAPAGTAQLLVSCRTWENVGNIQVENGSTATDYEAYHNGGTATAEMLLKVDDYQDEQEILSGAVTRKIGVIVLDGTENWSYLTSSGYERFSYVLPNLSVNANIKRILLCNYYDSYSASSVYSNKPTYSCWIEDGKNLRFHNNDYTTVTSWKAWLASKLATGTPVIVIYPLAEQTTESVAGQTLQVTDGDNTVSITQASLTGLELEAKYQAAVSLTIQEVEDAQLSPDVEVTIE